MRAISKEERKQYRLLNDRRIFQDFGGNCFRMSMKDIRRARRFARNERKLNKERENLTISDGIKVLRCVKYGDNIPKWLIRKYPILMLHLKHNRGMSILFIEDIMRRKLYRDEI